MSSRLVKYRQLKYLLWFCFQEFDIYDFFLGVSHELQVKIHFTLAYPLNIALEPEARKDSTKARTASVTSNSLLTYSILFV